LEVVDRVRKLISRVSEDPEEARSMMQLVLGMARARVIFRKCRLGHRVSALGPVRVDADGTIALGERVVFVAGMIPSELRAARGAEISVGADCSLNYGVSIEAHGRIAVGERCMLGSMVRICDRDRDRVSPIELGNDVWVAHGAVIEPGVTIGEGAAVSAGSVVVDDVPPRYLALGNPARNIPLAGLPRK
jgi:serine acetyltransferase